MVALHRSFLDAEIATAEQLVDQLERRPVRCNADRDILNRAQAKLRALLVRRDVAAKR